MQAPSQQVLHAPPLQAPALGGSMIPPPPTFYAAPPAAATQQVPPAQAPRYPSTIPPPPLSAGARTPAPAAPPSPSGRASGAGSTGGGGSRIDPAQIPRPSYAPPGAPVMYDTRLSGAAVPPPAAGSPFVARDIGSCSPRFMRATMHAVPTTSDLLSSSGLPLAVLVSPLALPGPGEEPVPLVNPGESGPLRCSRCKAYMNAFVRWVEGGRVWQCSLCNANNDTPPDYYCPCGPDGRRVDADSRPELCRGSVDYVAGDAYCVRPPMAPTYLFLIDVGSAAVASGVTASACDAVKRVLPCLAGGPRALAAVATYDCVAHFYKLRKPGSSPHMLIAADAVAPSAPAPAAQLLVNAQERLADLEALLDAIPGMFATPRAGGCALGAGLKAAAAVLAGRGGRVIAFAAGMPTLGFGALQPRPGGADSEAPKALAPGDPAYARLAMDAAEQQVAFDLFLAPPALGQAVDVATLGVLPSHTGGSLYRYPGYTPALDFAQLHNDLAWCVSRPQAFEAVARLRASTGLELAGDAQGYFAKRAPADMDLPALDCDKALLLRLSIEERLRDGGDAVLQCALLYSTPEGARFIRVHTLALPITNALPGVFRAADLDLCLAAAARRVAADLLRGPSSPSPAALRDRATADAVSALHAYRRYCAANSSAGQLILPEALKLLPLLTLGLIKSPGLRPDSPPDERAAWALRTLASAADAATPSVHARLFDVASLPEPEGPDDTDADDGAIPGTNWLSSERLRPDGVVLLENGHEALLHVGPSAPPALLVALFGTEAPASGAPLPMLRTPQSRALARLLRAVRRHRGAYMRLRVVRRPDPAAEAAFFRLMIEDRSADGMSYVEYLCHVHRQIQARFS